MPDLVPTKTKSLQGASDLTLLAPIKRGLSPALDARSYESRLRMLLTTLSVGRTSSKEAQPTPLIDDPIDRIRAIHSFRLAIVGEPMKPQLLLAVTFDGGWEPYMRRIWRDLGPLLDVIFCHCDGYLTACNHSYAAYIGWVRSAQVTTEFFYVASSLTVNDLHYLRATERDRLDAPLPTPPVPASPDPSAALAQAWPALTALYRLADMYLPQGEARLGDDADVLLRAARHLLGGALGVLEEAARRGEGRTPTERAALQWVAHAPAPAPVRPVSDAPFQPARVQGGIVDAYPAMTHGCVLLIRLDNAAAALALLKYLEGQVTSAQQQVDPHTLPLPCVNLAFTAPGLQVAGVPAATLAQMPIEFREGMAARASILGDHAHHHPTRWSLPEHNWPPGTGGAGVELSSVHAVVQLATRSLPSRAHDDFFADATHPLRAEVERLGALVDDGVHILSVQATQRYLDTLDDRPGGHFGYVDGLSQPKVGGPPPTDPGYADHVPLGDVFLGHENSLNDPPCTGRLWDDSSFMVMRKLRQDVAAFEALVSSSGQPPDDIKALLMGRRANGDNLIDGTPSNHFDYVSDPHGKVCPFQSHVRRANPRTPAGSRPDMTTVPRILRRGMSYGPPYRDQPKAERGLLFVAYNASIAEQFEVIQAWLSGGNASAAHTYSARRDPFLGAAAAADPPHFVFHGGAVALPPEPLVTLQWGLYAFVPSMRALAELQDLAREAAAREHMPVPLCPYHQQQVDDTRQRERTGLALKGDAVIKGLQMIERLSGLDAAKTQWKVVLEDFGARLSGTSRAVWAAVRELHGGVLATPYGVLVCHRAAVKQVFDNAHGVYTVAGYNERLVHSIGEIYLGEDDRHRHDVQAQGVNLAIFAVSEAQAFASAWSCMASTVRGLLPASPGDALAVEVKDLVDGALALFCAQWFGIPDGTVIQAGGWSVGAPDTATCPGHFHSPSRYTFQPHPGPETTLAGRQQGAALRTAVTRLVNDAAGRAAIRQSILGGPIDAAAADNTALLVSNLVGAMMGMLPTVDGNLRGALYDWVRDASLWDLQLAYRSAPDTPAYSRARDTVLPALVTAMQQHPTPELVWRTATLTHTLKGVKVNAGETVVVSIVSATQQRALQLSSEHFPAHDTIDTTHPLWPVFGGVRDSPEAPTPLHACPGYKMAMGMLLGLIAGLLDSAALSPALSATMLKIRPR